MSTSLLYHAFGVRGYKYVNARYEKGTVIFSICQKGHTLRCSACGSRRVIRRGSKLQQALEINRPLQHPGSDPVGPGKPGFLLRPLSIQE